MRTHSIKPRCTCLICISYFKHSTHTPYLHLLQPLLRLVLLHIARRIILLHVLRAVLGEKVGGPTTRPRLIVAMLAELFVAVLPLGQEAVYVDVPRTYHIVMYVGRVFYGV